MRYRGQGHNLEVALTDDVLHGDDANGLSATFHRRYHDVYGTSDPSVPVELVTARLTLVGRTRKRPLREVGAPPAAPAARTREVFVRGHASAVPAFARRDLGVGWQRRGPCLIDQLDSTTFVQPGWHVRVDRYGILHLEHEPA